MYAKIFRQIYDSTLADHWQALVTFQQMLVLKDRHGEVDMTATAISRTTGIPAKIITAGIKKLLEPDPHSRTKEHDGRRIIPLDPDRDWGWFVVNHEKYRSFVDQETKREQDRERQRKHREKDVTPGHAPSRYTDADTNTDKILKPFRAIETNGAGGFHAFYQSYPRKKSRGTAEKAWKKLNPDKPLYESIMAGLEKSKEEWQRRDKDKIPYPATWLNARGWDDEFNPKQKGPYCD